MIAIFRISIELGYLNESRIIWLKELLIKFNLPVSYSASYLHMDKKTLLNVCMNLVFKDKKRNYQNLRLVILTENRSLILHETSDNKLLQLGFEEVICD